MSAGINFTNVNDRDGLTFDSSLCSSPGLLTNAKLQNLEAHFAGAVGPVKLNAEVDMQMGMAPIWRRDQA